MTADRIQKYAQEIAELADCCEEAMPSAIRVITPILARLAAEARREGMERIVTLSEHLFGSDWAQRMRKLAQADAEKEPT